VEINLTLLSCVYIREVWHRLLTIVGLHTWAPQHQDSLLQWWQHHRAQAPRALRKCFDSMFMLSAWSIWKERNRGGARWQTSIASSALPGHHGHSKCLIIEPHRCWVRSAVGSLLGYNILVANRSPSSRSFGDVIHNLMRLSFPFCSVDPGHVVSHRGLPGFCIVLSLLLNEIRAIARSRKKRTETQM
jgi:hypothetical protein